MKMCSTRAAEKQNVALQSSWEWLVLLWFWCVVMCLHVVHWGANNVMIRSTGLSNQNLLLMGCFRPSLPCFVTDTCVWFQSKAVRHCKWLPCGMWTGIQEEPERRKLVEQGSRVGRTAPMARHCRPHPGAPQPGRPPWSCVQLALRASGWKTAVTAWTLRGSGVGWSLYDKSWQSQILPKSWKMEGIGLRQLVSAMATHRLLL